MRRNVGSGRVFRTVPSAGCRHAFETYVLANAIAGLDCGLYRYLPLDHALVLERQAGPDFLARQHEVVLGQTFVPKAAICPTICACVLILYKYYNYVSRDSNGNGVVGFVDEIEGEEPFPAGTMSLALGGSFLGSCFIQKEPFYTAQNVGILQEKEPLSIYSKLFIIKKRALGLEPSVTLFDQSAPEPPAVPGDGLRAGRDAQNLSPTCCPQYDTGKCEKT